jgi:hypothetical protein
MSMIFEGRLSDSPYVERIWRVRAATDFSPICPADGRWNLLLTIRDGRVRTSVEGPLTRAKTKNHFEGTEWLVIKFTLGAFMPHLPIRRFLDEEAILPEGARKSFWLNGSTWQFPDYENVENFVGKLVREDLLSIDPVVKAVLQDQPPAMSFRNVRRRFVRATGLTHSYVRQIERAQYALALLEQGVPTSRT